MQPQPPDVSSLAPQRFVEVLTQIRAGGGLRRVLLAEHPGVPPQPRQWSAMTRVPFIMLCLDGRFDVQIWRGAGLERYNLSAGEGIWYLPDTWVDVHHYQCRQYVRITFDCNHTLLGLKDLEAPGAPDFGDDLATHALPAVPGPLAAAAMARLANLPQDLPTREWVLRDLVAVVLWEVEDQIRRSRESLGATRALWLAMRDHVAIHWREGCSRADLARRFGVSPGHVSRVFQQEGGGTMVHYLQEQRIRHACDRLRSTDEDLDTIANACGFQSANYLVRVFRQHLACSPGRWRQRHRL
jgi:AraC-like DNA-binding protein